MLYVAERDLGHNDRARRTARSERDEDAKVDLQTDKEGKYPK